MTSHVISATGNQSSLTPYDWSSKAVDKPTITISAPANGATYGQGQRVTAAYSCTAAAGATLASCTGTVPNGQPIDTRNPGPHSFTVTATDDHGSSSSQTATYTIKAQAAPALSGLRQSAKVWRGDNKLPHMSANGRSMPTGTTFSFTLNMSAKVNFSFNQTVSGRKVHGRCVAQTKNNKTKPRCTHTVGFGSFTVAAQTGAHKVRFAGRISPNKKLRPGTYTVTITATSSSGLRSTPHTLSFTIVK